ncbi:hypothetical protein CAPTEDRAFT_189457 [Capitella teleta]|uniref:Uncharacterized protein n=1 Tax=Capitella teleta TaxID=283909 RepID=R7V7G2_CAPTE|nr:hypothetical protein CAPTEDRAFT_189457 [Capitella teleta]|eukprot:ELU12316.1 hypothetical protein CAPTEDRAFT_189457 [Capitella teleta]
MEAEGRTKKMTEKGRSYEMEKCCSSFRKTYLQWKENARGIRLRLREHCSIEMLEDLKFRIQEQAEMLQGIVERLHRIGALQPDVVQKMDTCNELTLSLIEMIDERIEEAVQNFVCILLSLNTTTVFITNSASMLPFLSKHQGCDPDFREVLKRK